MTLRQVFTHITNIYHNLFAQLCNRHCEKYEIVEYNMPTQIVTIKLRGKLAIIKIRFAEAINDISILRNLSAIDACWIGACYGRLLRREQLSGGSLKVARKNCFMLTKCRGIYQIVSQDRDGKIGFVNKKNNRYFSQPALDIAQDKALITRFDPTQACYLGILAGIALETQKQRTHTSVNTVEATHNNEDITTSKSLKVPHLRLVK